MSVNVLCVFCHQNTFIKINPKSAFELFDKVGQGCNCKKMTNLCKKRRKESRVNWHPITLQRSVILVWSYFLLCAANNEQHENHLKNDEEKKGKKEEETNHQPFPCGNLRKSRKDYQSKTDKISFSFWKTELVFCFTAYCDLQLQLHCTVGQVRTRKYRMNIHVR